MNNSSESHFSNKRLPHASRRHLRSQTVYHPTEEDQQVFQMAKVFLNVSESDMLNTISADHAKFGQAFTAQDAKDSLDTLSMFQNLPTPGKVPTAQQAQNLKRAKNLLFDR